MLDEADWCYDTTVADEVHDSHLVARQASGA